MAHVRLVPAWAFMLAAGMGMAALAEEAPLRATDPLWQAVAPPIEHDLPVGPLPWTGDTPRLGVRDFQFAVVSDNSGRPRPGVFRKAMEKVELLQPAFVMSVGDLIDGRAPGELTAAGIEAEWDAFLPDLDGLSVPFFFVPGNHDSNKTVKQQVWRERFGPLHYSFTYMDVLFVILQTNDLEETRPGYSQAQLEWLEQTLAEHQDARWTFVFQHHPFWITSPLTWRPVQELLRGRKHTVFAGHLHTYMHVKRRNIQYLTLAATGGSSPLRGPAYGEMDHLMWVTVTDDGPKMASIDLEGIRPADFRSTGLALAMEPYRREETIQAAPARLQPGSDEISWEASFENPLTRPARLRVLVEAQPDLFVSPSAVDEWVEPNASATARITARLPHGLPASRLQPVALHWSAEYEPVDTPPLQMRGVHRLVTAATHDAFALDEVAVDGKLDEWPALPVSMRQPAQVIHNESAWKGPRDCHFEFAVASNETHVFVALRVHDDETRTALHFDYQDMAILTLRAAGAEPMEAALRREDVVRIVAGEGLERDEIERQERFNQNRNYDAYSLGAEAVMNPRTDGADYEFSFPREILERVGKKSTEHIQLNLVVNDWDESDAALGISFLAWRPRWESSAYDPGVGVFRLAP